MWLNKLGLRASSQDSGNLSLRLGERHQLEDQSPKPKSSFYKCKN